MKNLNHLLLLFAIIANSTCLAATKIIDKVAAIVNKSVVLESEINSFMQYLKLNATTQADKQFIKLINTSTMRAHILERLIKDKIILQVGNKLGIKISDEQLDYTITKIAKQNNMTLDNLRSYLANAGISYVTYRDHINKEMLISEVRNNEVRRRLIIKPQEIDVLAKYISNNNYNYLNKELNISYIIIPVPEQPTYENILEAEKKASYILDKAIKGNDFNKLVNSVVRQESLIYNNINWRNLKDLPEIFAKPLSVANKGNIVGPIRSSLGFNIFKVNDVRTSTNKNQGISVKEIHIRHIMLKKSKFLTENQAKIKLKQISDNIKIGKISFAKAAKIFSEDLSSSNNGGDLGWITAADIYDLAFSNALMKLNKNKISAPMHSYSGWHIIELLDSRIVDKTNIANKIQAYRILFSRKFSEETENWIKEQIAKSYIKIISNY